MPRAQAFAVAAVLLVLSWVAPVAAQGGDVRFCFNDWPPYVKVVGGAPVGITIDIMREAAKRAGFTIRFDELPWKRCLEMVREGAYDGVLDAMERPEFLQGPTSFSAYTNTVWVRAESDLQRLDFAALSKKTIGLVSGYKYPEALLAALQGAGVAIDYAVDDATNIRKLAFGRVAAIVGDFGSTMLVVRDKGLKLRPLTPTHSSDQLYPSFNPARGDAHKAIDAALEAMLRDGTVERVYRSHLGVGFGELNGQ